MRLPIAVLSFCVVFAIAGCPEKVQEKVEAVQETQKDLGHAPKAEIDRAKRSLNKAEVKIQNKLDKVDKLTE